MVLAQGLTGFADFALARQKHQDVTWTHAGALVHRTNDGLNHVPLFVTREAAFVPTCGAILSLRFIGVGDRTPANIDGIEPAGNLDDRRRLAVTIGKMGGKPLGVNGGRGDDDLKVRPPGQQLPQITQQKIDVQAAFMRLVDDDSVVAFEQRVTLGLGEQNAVSHQLDSSLPAATILEPDLIAHPLPQG